MEAIKKILIATDGSDNTKEAVSSGLWLAKELGAEVTALYVIDQTSFVSFPMDSSIVSVYSLLENEGKRAVEDVKAEGDAAGVKVTLSRLETPGTPLPADEVIGDGHEMSNVSLEEELVDLITTGHSFSANIKTIQTEDEMQGALLDIIA